MSRSSADGISPDEAGDDAVDEAGAQAESGEPAMSAPQAEASVSAQKAMPERLPAPDPAAEARAAVSDPEVAG